MKTYIIVNSSNTVIDVTSHVENVNAPLLDDKSNTLIELDRMPVYIGDEFDPKVMGIIAHPENYPKPTTDDLAEEQIQAEMRRLAVASLKTKGILPADFVDKLAVAEKVITTEEVSR